MHNILSYSTWFAQSRRRTFDEKFIRKNFVYSLQSERDPAAQRRASVRNVIVEKYLELLPKVQQELALRPEKSIRQNMTKHREGW